MKAKKEPYLDYEIMLLDMKILKKEVKKCLKKGNEDYLNELFLYGCWANKSELVNSDRDAMFKGISLLHRKGFSIFNSIEKNYSGKVIKTLLDGGTDPNLKDNRGFTALMFAAIYGRTQAVQELLKHPKTNPNLQGRNGWTALMYATYNGNTQAVQELLKHPDIDPNLQDKNGSTALIYAMERKDTLAVQELLKHPKINPNLKDYAGDTALIKAVSYGLTQVIQELLKHPDIDPNIKEGGWTALMRAAMNGRTQAVQELLKHPKIKPNQQDNNYDTALILATRWGRTQAVQELLKHPAIDVTLTNNKVQTAWDLAQDGIREQFPELHPRYKDDNIKNNQIILLKEISKELLQIASTGVKDKERIRAISEIIEKI